MDVGFIICIMQNHVSGYFLFTFLDFGKKSSDAYTDLNSMVTGRYFNSNRKLTFGITNVIYVYILCMYKSLRKYASLGYCMLKPIATTSWYQKYPGRHDWNGCSRQFFILAAFPPNVARPLSP